MVVCQVFFLSMTWLLDVLVFDVEPPIKNTSSEDGKQAAEFFEFYSILKVEVGGKGAKFAPRNSKGDNQGDDEIN